MHNRVIELTLEEIDEDNFMSEGGAFCDSGFVPSVAYYVSDIEEDIEQEVNDIIDQLKEIADYNPERRSFTFHENAKLVWFEEKYKNFLDEITTTSFIDFCSEYKVNRISNALEDKKGFYVYHGYSDSYESMDSFIRNLGVDTEYYLGGILSYKA